MGGGCASFRLWRRDGESVGPVSTRHLLAVNCAKGCCRLNLGRPPFVPATVGEERATTRLRFTCPRGTRPLGVLCYGDEVCLSASDGSCSFEMPGINFNRHLGLGSPRADDAPSEAELARDDSWSSTFHVEHVDAAAGTSSSSSSSSTSSSAPSSSSSA